MDLTSSVERVESPLEEIANSISHGVGLAAAIAAAPFLILRAAHRGAASIAASAVFVAGVVSLYLASTLYHALPRNRAKRVFRVLDHAAICLLIAGTYTPLTLVALGGPIGWLLFAAIWSLAASGIALACFGVGRRPKLTTALYLVMGWLIVLDARHLLAVVGPAGVAWILAGGVSYTAGVGFFAARRLRFAHFVFHLLVVAGTVCHFVAIYGHAT